MVFLILQKRRQPALIAAVSFLLVHGGLSVFYAYALTGDRHVQTWLRKPENKLTNDIICVFCHLGYGYGYYVLLVRPWMMSMQLPYVLGRGIQKKLKASQPIPDNDVENELEDMLPESEETKTKARLNRSFKCLKYFFWVFHFVICLGMVYLAWFCSHRRNQAISFYFTITWSAGWLVLDTGRRCTMALWNHPEFKYDYYFALI